MFFDVLEQLGIMTYHIMTYHIMTYHNRLIQNVHIVIGCARSCEQTSSGLGMGGLWQDEGS